MYRRDERYSNYTPMVEGEKRCGALRANLKWIKKRKVSITPSRSRKTDKTKNEQLTQGAREERRLREE